MMSFIKFLLEQKTDTLVFGFGRYSPPTKGHIYHFLSIKEWAKKQNFPYKIYASKTFDNKNNPVPIDEKIWYIKKAIPGINIDVATNMFSIVDDLSTKSNIKNVIYFAGGDYFEDKSEKSMLDRLRKHAKEKGINLIAKSSGERVPGISGSDLRRAALLNDFETFKKGSPINIGNITEKDVKKMFDIVRNNLRT